MGAESCRGGCGDLSPSRRSAGRVLGHIQGHGQAGCFRGGPAGARGMGCAPALWRGGGEKPGAALDRGQSADSFFRAVGTWRGGGRRPGRQPGARWPRGQRQRDSRAIARCPAWTSPRPGQRVVAAFAGRAWRQPSAHRQPQGPFRHGGGGGRELGNRAAFPRRREASVREIRELRNREQSGVWCRKSDPARKPSRPAPGRLA